MRFHFSRMYEDTQQTKRSYHKLCHRSSANGEWRSSLKLLTGIPANEETSDAPFHIDSHPSHSRIFVPMVTAQCSVYPLCKKVL